MEPQAVVAGTDTSGPWYAQLRPKHWRILSASFLGWVFDGYEAYVLFVVMPFVLKATLAPQQLASGAVWAGIAIGVTLLGWGVGGMIGGILADYIGRKRMMVYSILLYALFSGLTAFSTTFWMFALLRFVTGLAMGSEWSTGVALLAETWPNRARPKGAGFLQSGFGFGTLFAAVVWLVMSQLNPLGDNTWRLMFIIGALPALFCLYIRRSVDESERWVQAVKQQKALHAGKPGAKPQRPFTLSEIFRDAESRRRVLLAFLLSLAATVGWWAVSSWLPAYAVVVAKASGDAHPALWGPRVATFYNLGAIAAYLVSGFIADAVGRRWFLFLGFLGALVSTVLTYAGTHSSMVALTAIAFVNGFFTLGCAYSWMAIYPAELFQSQVRATAAAFIFNAARLLAWLFPIIAGTIIQFAGGIAHAALILSSIYVLGLIVPWWMPETNGKDLPA